MAIVKTRLNKTEEILIETEEPQLVPKDSDGFDEYRDGESTIPESVQQFIEDSTDLFGKAMNTIRACADQITTTIHNMEDKVKPTKVETTLAIKLSAEAGG